MEEQIGHEAFLAVRRGYATPPPPLPDGDPRLPENDPRYAALDPSLLPRSESLADTAKRALPYFYEAIVPQIVSGKRVLVSAHGNSLRALTMQIENLTPDEVVHLEIPTGVPIRYRFSERMEMVEKEVVGQ